MAVRMFLEELAKARGKRMIDLHYECRIPLSTMQRYWKGVGVDGKPLQAVSLVHIGSLCKALQCEVGDLLRQVPDESEGSDAD